MNRRPIAAILTLTVCASALLLFAEEPEDPNPITLDVPQTQVSHLEQIAGIAMSPGNPPVHVKLYVDGECVAVDNITDPGDDCLNEFSFGATQSMVGKTVKVVATDGLGNRATVYITVR